MAKRIAQKPEAPHLRYGYRIGTLEKGTPRISDQHRGLASCGTNSIVFQTLKTSRCDIPVLHSGDLDTPCDTPFKSQTYFLLRPFGLVLQSRMTSVQDLVDLSGIFSLPPKCWSPGRKGKAKAEGCSSCMFLLGPGHRLEAHPAMNSVVNYAEFTERQKMSQNWSTWITTKNWFLYLKLTHHIQYPQ